MSDPIQTVAMRICDLRDIAGLSQEQVAERAGVPLEEYIAYEAGTRDFSFSHLFNIAGVLGVDISDLLTGESPKLKGYILTRAGKASRSSAAKRINTNIWPTISAIRRPSPLWSRWITIPVARKNRRIRMRGRNLIMCWKDT